ncbi:TraR/DksA C4-type zinc finger protein [Myxococcota bacterium]|nr:TraR/DksA C4-type zinc finger protein [Myxococcota bacterium]
MSALLLPDGAVDLNAMREHLLMELGHLAGRQDKIQSHLQNEDREIPHDWTEAAQLQENDEVLEALEESGRTRISALRAALQRIDDGSYGECALCGDEIEPRRLVAMPTTTRCVRCADG